MWAGESVSTMDDCLYFQTVKNYDELVNGAEELAGTLSGLINDSAGLCLTAPSPLYLLPLLLLFLLYMTTVARKPLQAMKAQYEEYVYITTPPPLLPPTTMTHPLHYNTLIIQPRLLSSACCSYVVFTCCFRGCGGGITY